MIREEIVEEVMFEIFNFMKLNYHKSYTSSGWENFRGRVGFTDVMEKAINLALDKQEKENAK